MSVSVECAISYSLGSSFRAVDHWLCRLLKLDFLTLLLCRLSSLYFPSEQILKMVELTLIDSEVDHSRQRHSEFVGFS